MNLNLPFLLYCRKLGLGGSVRIYILIYNPNSLPINVFWILIDNTTKSVIWIAEVVFMFCQEPLAVTPINSNTVLSKRSEDINHRHLRHQDINIVWDWSKLSLAQPCRRCLWAKEVPYIYWISSLKSVSEETYYNTLDYSMHLRIEVYWSYKLNKYDTLVNLYFNPIDIYSSVLHVNSKHPLGLIVYLI